MVTVQASTLGFLSLLFSHLACSAYCLSHNPSKPPPGIPRMPCCSLGVIFWNLSPSTPLLEAHLHPPHHLQRRHELPLRPLHAESVHDPGHSLDFASIEILHKLRPEKFRECVLNYDGGDGLDWLDCWSCGCVVDLVHIVLTGFWFWFDVLARSSYVMIGRIVKAL